MMKQNKSSDDKSKNNDTTDAVSKLVEISNMKYDDVIVNLKLIGQLKEDQRLRIRDNAFDIDQRYGHTLVRWLWSDSRDKSIEFLTKIVESAEFHSTRLNEEMETNNNDKDTNHKLNNLTNDLHASLNGIDKLRITYRNDHVFRSKLDVITDKIRVIIENNMDRKNKN